MNLGNSQPATMLNKNLVPTKRIELSDSSISSGAKVCIPEDTSGFIADKSAFASADEKSLLNVNEVK